MVGRQIVALVVWVQFPVFTPYAAVAKLVNAIDSKSIFPEEFAGSNPARRTTLMPTLKHLIAIMMLLVKLFSLDRLSRLTGKQTINISG